MSRFTIASNQVDIAGGEVMLLHPAVAARDLGHDVTVVGPASPPTCATARRMKASTSSASPARTPVPTCATCAAGTTAPTRSVVVQRTSSPVRHDRTSIQRRSSASGARRKAQGAGCSRPARSPAHGGAVPNDAVSGGPVRCADELVAATGADSNASSDGRSGAARLPRPALARQGSARSSRRDVTARSARPRPIHAAAGGCDPIRAAAGDDRSGRIARSSRHKRGARRLDGPR